MGGPESLPRTRPPHLHRHGAHEDPGGALEGHSDALRVRVSMLNDPSDLSGHHRVRPAVRATGSPHSQGLLLIQQRQMSGQQTYTEEVAGWLGRRGLPTLQARWRSRGSAGRRADLATSKEEPDASVCSGRRLGGADDVFPAQSRVAQLDHDGARKCRISADGHGLPRKHRGNPCFPTAWEGRAPRLPGVRISLPPPRPTRIALVFGQLVWRALPD
jgi:hypothetical protein